MTSRDHSCCNEPTWSWVFLTKTLTDRNTALCILPPQKWNRKWCLRSWATRDWVKKLSNASMTCSIASYKLTSSRKCCCGLNSGKSCKRIQNRHKVQLHPSHSNSSLSKSRPNQLRKSRFLSFTKHPIAICSKRCKCLSESQSDHLLNLISSECRCQLNRCGKT